MEIQNLERNSQMPLFGRATMQTRTEMVPTGDEAIKAARAAIWQAWQIGLQQSGNTIYPKAPLLDREPMEPEI